MPRSVISLLFIFLLGTAAHAKDESILLFNGKDLTGWHKVGGNGVFEVKDGAIHGHGVNINGNTFLTSDKTYDNFVLEMEARFEMDETIANSGIQFRSANVNNHLTGYQYEIENKAENNTGGVYDEGGTRGYISPFIPCHWIQTTNYKELMEKHGADVAAFQKKTFTLLKKRDWNHIKIRCQDGHVQTWLNGEKQADFKDPEGTGYRSGVIGLQLHGGKKCDVSWRNIRLTPLSKPGG